MKNDQRRWLAYEIRRLASRGASQREIASALRIARRTVVSILTEVQRERAEGEDNEE